MTTEIEIKLALAPEDADAVWRTPALSRLLRGKPARRTLFSAYYDTPDCFLRDHGVALRLRRDGRRWVQTLKHRGDAVGGLHTRNEHETPVAAQLLSFPAIIDAGGAHLIDDDDRRRAITVMFTTEFIRTTALLEPVPGQQVEISVDRGFVVAGRRREPLCEMELELKQGEPGCLFDLAEALVEELPLRVDNVSKAERGYRLAAGARARPVKAATAALEATTPVDDALRRVASACVQQLQANEFGVLESRDPEFLHQARVALRRLRAAFSVFSRAAPKAARAGRVDALRAIDLTLADARDWDVFCAGFLPQALADLPANGAAETLRRRAMALRARARRAARATLASRDYQRALLGMARLLVTREWQSLRQAPAAAAAGAPLHGFARETLARQRKRLRKLAHGCERSDPRQLHALRLRVKKLRYAGEFLSPLFSRKASRAFLSKLERLQTVLGEHNDVATAARLLEALAPGSPDGDAQRVLDYLGGYLAARRRGSLDKLESALRRAIDAKPFW
jgi:triphosphatase